MLSIVFLIVNLLLGIKALLQNRIILYRKKSITGRSAKIIGIILIIGGLLSPISYGISSMISVVISIMIGFIGLKSEDQSDNVEQSQDVIIMPGGFRVESNNRNVEISLDDEQERVNILHEPSEAPAEGIPEELPPIQNKYTLPPIPDTWSTQPKSIDPVLPHPSPSSSAATNRNPILEVIKGNLSRPYFEINKPNFLIGRDQTSDLQILDPKISRKHVRFRYAQGNWFLQDQGSRSGTRLNGKKINASKLNDGDEIIIINYYFIFKNKVVKQ
jgi:hypothetical protein